MDKVVIITECRRFKFNYGETLQAVALNRYISDMGYKCITASYENEKSDLHDWFNKNLNNSIVRGLKFELFRLMNLRHYIMRSYNKSKFEEIIEDAYAVVCGSDCIWYEKCYNSIYFLNFPTKRIKKIAYAPSLRDSVVTDTYKMRVARWAKQIQYLSTREKSGSEIIQDITGRDVITVLDPTMLIGKKEWDKLCSRRRIRKPYILVYIIGQISSQLLYINQVREYYSDKEIIVIHMDNNDDDIGGEVIYDAGPSDFISLIKYADVVITDSFHGAAFAIMYHKQVYSFKRTVNGQDIYDNDCRITNLFSLFGINNYYYENDKIDFKKSKINYKKIDNIYFSEQQKSKKYLENALKQ